MLNDPFQDDPAPPTPTPTSLPAEVRRVPANQLKPVSVLPKQAASSRPTSPVSQTEAAKTSPYKIVNSEPPAAPPKTTARKPASAIIATEEVRTVPARSILRRASAESEAIEPAPHNINRARALPIVRSQSPDHTDNEIPVNPLR